VKKALVLLALLVVAIPAFAQENVGTGFDFSAGLGTDLLPDPNDPTTLESWSKLALQPEFSVGKFGIGLDLMLRFKLGTGTSAFEVYEPDWIPQNGQTIFDVYLPKILYIRYGMQWEDPFYVKLGSISDFTLGNGLIVDNYSNMRFLPQRRIFGMQLGVDGSLFGVPYVGVEALTGNVTQFDVIGGRVYIKPLAFMEKSLLGRLQLGAIGVYDRDPYLYVDDAMYTIRYSTQPSEPIYVLGADITLPVIQSGVFSLTTFAEGAREMNSSMGAMAGVRGRVAHFILYGAQFRYFQDDFIPSYFDANYDLYRADRFLYIKSHVPAGSNFTPSWLASLGFDLFESSLVFRAALDAPFAWISDPTYASENPADYPHLLGSIKLGRGLIPNVDIAARYEKFFLGKKTSGDVWQDLIDPENASIGMTVSYKAGTALVTMDYVYTWNPTKQDYDVVSSLSVGFEL